jgi:transcriptional regulator with XRE-family HTH domain
MKGGELRNYLRTYRKRAGLSQREVAVVVGLKSAATLSRCEWGHRLPSLQTALAFEALFGVPVGQLFSGASEAIDRETEERLQKLESVLQKTSGAGPKAPITAKKLVWLTGRKIGELEML